MIARFGIIRDVVGTEGFDDRGAVVSRGDRQSIDWLAGPAVMQVKVRLLEIDEPLVLHVLGHEAEAQPRELIRSVVLAIRDRRARYERLTLPAILRSCHARMLACSHARMLACSRRIDD